MGTKGELVVGSIDTINLKGNKLGQFAEYLISNRWRCKDSPNGAHGWIIPDRGEATCLYCKNNRRFFKSMEEMRHSNNQYNILVTKKFENEEYII
jgi:hypothetical protein